MNPSEAFEAGRTRQIREQGADANLLDLSRRWMHEVFPYQYAYHFSWMGRPTIQFPQDLLILQELIWAVRPDLIIETGVAHGGTTVFLASMLSLLGENGLVVGVDIEIRPHNRQTLEAHPVFGRIRLIEGDSTSPTTLEFVKKEAGTRRRAMVILDSNHTHQHVLDELRLYAPLVPAGSIIVVFDTTIEESEHAFPDRPWGKGNNPATAVSAFLEENDRFQVDRSLDHKLLITVARGGFLRCVRD